MDPAEKAKDQQSQASAVTQSPALPLPKQPAPEKSATAATANTPSAPSTSKVVAPSLHAGLLATQKEELRSIFGSRIREGTAVTSEEVRLTIRASTVLPMLLMPSSRIKQVVNYVNHLVRKTTAAASTPSSEDTPAQKASGWLGKYDNPSSRSDTIRQHEWNPSETDLLSKAFKTYLKLPSTSTIRILVMEADDRLKAILECNKWQRIYNKIKSIFRARK